MTKPLSLMNEPVEGELEMILERQGLTALPMTLLYVFRAEPVLELKDRIFERRMIICTGEGLAGRFYPCLLTDEGLI